MFDLILYAIPFFTVTLFLEMASFYFLPDDDERGYELRDSTTSLAMGLGNVAVNAGWKLVVVLFVYAAVYELSPLSLPPTIRGPGWHCSSPTTSSTTGITAPTTRSGSSGPATSCISSEHHNPSTALRQPWTRSARCRIDSFAALGFSPWMIMLQQSISLVYQFFIHTERVGKLWKLPSNS